MTTQNETPGARAGATGEFRREESRQHRKNTASVADPQGLSEIGLAGAFVERMCHSVRYVAERKSWLIRDGEVWSVDTTERVVDECCQFLREIVVNVSHADAQRLGKLSTVDAMLRITRADRAIVITLADANALLIVANGGI